MHLIVKLAPYVAMFFVVSSCTLTVNAVHTQGPVSDLIDETPSTSTVVSPPISVSAA